MHSTPDSETKRESTASVPSGPDVADRRRRMQVLVSGLVLAALFAAGLGGKAAAQSVRGVKAGAKKSYGELRSFSRGRRVERRLESERRRVTSVKLASRRYPGPSLRRTDRRLENRELERKREAREARIRKEWKQYQAERSRAAAEHRQNKKRRVF